MPLISKNKREMESEWQKEKPTKPTKNSPWHPPTSSCHPNHKATPPKHIESIQWPMKKAHQSTGSRFPSNAGWRRSTTKIYENGWFLLCIFDDHPKAFQQNHHHHSVIRFISNERSERFKRKQGETVTKIKKGSVQHSPAEAHSPAADPETFLYQYSTNPYPRTSHTSVMSIRL